MYEHKVVLYMLRLSGSVALSHFIPDISDLCLLFSVLLMVYQFFVFFLTKQQLLASLIFSIIFNFVDFCSFNVHSLSWLSGFFPPLLFLISWGRDLDYRFESLPHFWCRFSAIHFPLRIALAAFHKFRYVCFHFHSVLCTIISFNIFLIHVLLRNVLSHFTCLELFQALEFFSLLLSPYSTPLWSEGTLCVSPTSWHVLGVCSKPWDVPHSSKCPMNSWEDSIPSLLGGIF